ncbi:unnamed protein product [Cochlearia groenlandica]
MDTTTEDQSASSETTVRDEAKTRITDKENQRSEIWFESSPSYEPSPSIPKIKPRRSFNVENMRNFSDEEEEEEEGKSLKVKESSEAALAMEISSNMTKKEEECTSKASNTNKKNQNSRLGYLCPFSRDYIYFKHVVDDDVIDQTDNKENIPPPQAKAYSPKLTMSSTKNHQAGRKDMSVLMPKNKLRSSQSKTTNQTMIRREANAKKLAGALKLVEENQAIKRQKLDGGKSRQILNPKPTTLPHKTKQGLVNKSFNLFPSAAKETRTENRKAFHLQTMLRARPSNVKTSTEIEQEELDKVPRFKAISLNKKLSLNSESCREKPLQRNTTPNPFLLRTEERGAMKVKKYVTELVHKKIEDKRVRIPKATPYPYTTDYPVVPPKPEPKHCTKPEPFQLESVARHEEAVRRGMEEMMRTEREEAQRRVFRAQPVIKVDPIPVPEKVLKHLTEFQEFSLQVDRRAVERADFDQKIKEKEMMYKRYREETKATKMLVEERALKQMRRTMVPQARPVPNFNNPFLPQKSNRETTKPKSPKLRVIRRIERRKMMSASTNTNT